jgi:hypothetical protein
LVEMDRLPVELPILEVHTARMISLMSPLGMQSRCQCHFEKRACV